MKQLIIDLAKDWNNEIKTILSSDDVSEIKIEKLKQNYPEILESIDNFKLRNEEDSYDNVFEFINDIIDSKEFKFEDIKDSAKIISDAIESFKPSLYIKDMISKDNDFVLEYLNLYINNKDKININMIKKNIKKDKDLNYRRIKTIFNKHIDDEYFISFITNVMEIKNVEEFFIKLNAFIDSSTVSFKDKDQLLILFRIMSSFLLNLNLKEDDILSRLKDINIANPITKEFISTEEFNNMMVFILTIYNIRKINEIC